MKKIDKVISVIFIIIFTLLIGCLFKPAAGDYLTINATRIKLNTLDGTVMVDVFKIDDQKCILPILFSNRPLACWLDNGSPE